MNRPIRNSSQLPSTFTQQNVSENLGSYTFGALFESSNPDIIIENGAVRALFSNGDATNAFPTHSGLALGEPGSSRTKFASKTINTDDIQITPSDDLQYNSMAIISQYVPSQLEAEYTTSSTDDVTVRSDLSVQKTSFVDASSSAYMDTTVKIKFVDQYLQVENYFQDSTDSWEANFDISSNYVPTRNVNSQKAHTDRSVGVSVKDFESWNTQGNFGPFYLEGDISIDSYGMPSLTPFSDPSKKLSSYTDYTLEVVPDNQTPDFGRYAVQVSTASAYKVRSFGSLLNSSNTVTSNLKSALTSDIEPTFNSSLVKSNIPSVLGDNDSTNPLSDFVPDEVILQPGFDLQITSSVQGSAIDLINNSLDKPFSIDATDMDFAPANMYALQNAVGEDDILNTYEYSDNYVEIINGSLDLNGVNDSNGSLTLGSDAEYLTSEQFDNGFVKFLQVNVISGLSGEDTYPRASKTSSSDSLNFNQLVVRYESDDDSHTEIGVIDTSLKTATDVNYSIETILTNTISSNTDYNNLSGYIGSMNNSVALVTQSNSTITPSAITYNNTNTSYPEALYVIDFVCQKNWEQNNLYNASGNVTLSGPSFNAYGTNTDTSTFRDLRIQLDAKTVGNLTNINNGWSLSCADSYLSTSNEFESCLQASDIQSLLGGANLGSLSITYGPAEASSIPASKLFQFADKMTFLYNGHSSVTYNDEFIVNPISSSESPITISQGDYSGIPSGCVLNKKALTTVFTVNIPFRLGAYTNLKITTPTITKTITYYTLTKDGVELPRRLLASVTENGGDALTSTVNNYSTTTNYALTANDLKPYFITLQKTVDDSNWTDILPQMSADMWYGNSTVINSSIGNFTFDFSLPLTLYNLNIARIYGDLSLEKGTNTFTVAGKSFSFSDILDNSMNSFDFTSDLPFSSVGTVLSLDSPTYNITSLGNNVPGTTTLSSSGYSFTYSNNLLLNLRVVVVKQTLFTVARTMDDNVDYYIKTISNGLLQLDTGIYTVGNLTNTRVGDYAVWSLNNDTASVKLYNGHSNNYLQIAVGETVNGAYLHANNSKLISRGVTFNWNRGYNVGTTDINRTATRVVFNIAGYRLGAYSTDYYVYYGQVRNPFGGLQITDQLSMYDASVTGEQYWDLQLASYGTYNISYKNNDDAFNNYTVPAYNFIIWQGVNKSFVNNTLNTISFNYRINYDAAGIDVYRISDYTNTSTTLGDYAYITSYSEIVLKNSNIDNIIGNVLNIHLDSNSSMVDLLVFFTVYPPFISFTAIDPSGISNIPFTPVVQNYKTYYKAVDTSSNTYKPFASSSNINNITFNDTRGMSYLDFFRGGRLSSAFIDGSIYTASDIVSYNRINYMCIVSTYQPSYVGDLNNIHLFRPWSPLTSTPPAYDNNASYSVGDYISWNGANYINKLESSGLNPLFSAYWTRWPQLLETTQNLYASIPTVINYNMIIDNYNFTVQMKQGLYDVSSNYITFYDGLIQATSDNATYLFGPLNASGAFIVKLNQLGVLPGFSELSNNIDPSFNYDLYNLKMTIGSAFINDGTEIYLEFVAGEAISHTTYVLEDQFVESGSMHVTVSKYSTDAANSIHNLSAMFYDRMSFGYTSKQSKVFSAPLPTTLPVSKRQRGDFIRSIAASISNNSPIVWSPKVNVDSGNLLNLQALTRSALTELVSMFSVDPNKPIKLNVFDLPNQGEWVNKSGAIMARIKYNGTLETSVIELPESQSQQSSSYPPISNM